VPLSAGDALPNDISLQRYGGLVTRGIAFAIDAALINLVALVVSLGATLIASLFHLPSQLKTILLALGAAAYVVWIVGYFVAFWCSTGQTPGNRVMQIRVVSATGDPVRVVRALVRCAGLVLAALPLFAGFLLIPFDSKRRGLQDRLARTLVLESPGASLAQRRLQARTGSSLSGDDGGEAVRFASSGRAERVSLGRGSDPARRVTVIHH
jgi:uncharacterized RDD family membrane protein YckC